MLKVPKNEFKHNSTLSIQLKKKETINFTNVLLKTEIYILS